MFKKYITVLLVGGVILLSIVCQGTFSPTSASEKWAIAMAGDPTLTPDPFGHFSGNETRAVHYMAFEPLYSWLTVTNPDQTISWKRMPILAESYERINPRTIRFRLKKGVKFHNGEDFTADDVKYSFDSIKKDPKNEYHRYIREITECKVIDPYTVDLASETPNSLLLDHCAWLVIVPKSRGLTEESIAAFKKNPAGTGPYKIVYHKQDEPIELEAWEKYRDGVMRPKYVIIKYILDTSTRLAALLAGEVDIIEFPDPAQFKIIESNKNLALATVKGGRVVLNEIQFLKPPFNNIKVRQAINYAIDRFSIVDKILEGRGMVVPSVLYDGWDGALPGLKPYPYDPKKAKRLLAEAGYPNGFEMKLLTPTGFLLKGKEVAEAIQKYLSDVGIKMKIEVAERARMFEIFYAGDFDLWQGIWGLAGYAPDAPLRWYLNWGFKEDKISGGVVPKEIKEIRALIDKAKAEMDLTKRTAIYEQINKLIFDNGVLIFTHAENLIFAYNKAKIVHWNPAFNVGLSQFVWYCDYYGMYPSGKKR